jgi:hypothetical protein
VTDTARILPGSLVLLFKVERQCVLQELRLCRRKAGLKRFTRTGRPEKAIIVRNATVEEFSKFLWIFYNERVILSAPSFFPSVFSSITQKI